MVGALLEDEGIVSPRHQRTIVGVLLFHRDLLYHTLDRSKLILTAKGHQNRTCTDGRVKTLGKASLGADVQICSQSTVILNESAADLLLKGSGSYSLNVDVLLRTVGVEELTADVHDGLSIPMHHQSGLCLDLCNGASLQVLRLSEREECINIFFFNDNGHTLLRLTDRKLGAVQSLILLGNCVQIDLQSVCKLTNSN